MASVPGRTAVALRTDRLLITATLAAPFCPSRGLVLRIQFHDNRIESSTSMSRSWLPVTSSDQVAFFLTFDDVLYCRLPQRPRGFSPQSFPTLQQELAQYKGSRTAVKRTGKRNGQSCMSILFARASRLFLFEFLSCLMCTLARLKRQLVRHVVFVNVAYIRRGLLADPLRSDNLYVVEPLVCIEAAPLCFFAHACDVARTRVIAGKRETMCGLLH